MVTPTEPTEDGAEAQAVTAEVTTEAETTARTFSQEEVNRMMAQTRKDTRGQFADYNDLKQRAARADELEQAQLSESEKLAQRAADAEKAAEEANQKIADAFISSEVKVKASQAGIIDPDAAYVLMDKKGVTYDPDGGVTGVDEAITQLLEDKPYLRGTPRSPNIIPEAGQPAPVTRLTPEQREAARLMGIPEEQYAQGL